MNPHVSLSCDCPKASVFNEKSAYGYLCQWKNRLETHSFCPSICQGGIYDKEILEIHCMIRREIQFIEIVCLLNDIKITFFNRRGKIEMIVGKAFWIFKGRTRIIEFNSPDIFPGIEFRIIENQSIIAFGSDINVCGFFVFDIVNTFFKALEKRWIDIIPTPFDGIVEDKR